MFLRHGTCTGLSTELQFICVICVVFFMFFFLCQNYLPYILEVFFISLAMRSPFVVGSGRQDSLLRACVDVLLFWEYVSEYVRGDPKHAHRNNKQLPRKKLVRSQYLREVFKI